MGSIPGHGTAQLFLRWVTNFGCKLSLDIITTQVNSILNPGWLNQVPASVGVKAGHSMLLGGRWESVVPYSMWFPTVVVVKQSPCKIENIQLGLFNVICFVWQLTSMSGSLVQCAMFETDQTLSQLWTYRQSNIHRKWACAWVWHKFHWCGMEWNGTHTAETYCWSNTCSDLKMSISVYTVWPS